MRGFSNLFLCSSFVVLGAGLSSCGKSISGNKIPRKFEIAEDKDPDAVAREDWFNLSPEKDSKEGMGVNRVYEELLKEKTQDLAPIIVAVIDSGVDITHEDLKNRIWTNPGETGLDANGKDKASNGVDDDSNGYVDDIHGWNYIGGYDAEGKPVSIGAETLEKTRIYKKLQTKIDSGLTLVDDEQKLYEKVKAQVIQEKSDAQDELAILVPALSEMEAAYPLVAPFLNNKPFGELTRPEVANIESPDATIVSARDTIVAAFDATKFTSVARMKVFVGRDNDAIQYNYNLDFDPRSPIVGDNPDDFSDKSYGNNDVSGIENDHGTHVSGMIAAERNNGIGINGVADSAIIMGLRAVPNGDERDKDIAAAIRYAADNGAQVVNMSFGKEYSPNRAQVQEAIEYAQAKGVLLIHAAGNDSKNTTVDNDSNFPTPTVLGSTDRFENWVELGASSAIKGAKLPAAFSNYGKKSVDVFAPGVKIESCIPGNKYAIFSGTSMASPSFAGAAALLWSVKPDLTAKEVKDLLLNTGRTYEGLMVDTPASGEVLPQLLFSDLSITGKIVDVFAAVNAVLDI